MFKFYEEECTYMVAETAPLGMVAGGVELVIILLIAVVLFGSRVPNAARATRESIFEFHDGRRRKLTKSDSEEDANGSSE